MSSTQFNEASGNEPAHSRRLWNSTFMRADKQPKARKYNAEDWDAQRPEITRLYEENTLDGVMKIMREQHGLDATPKQYKDRIKRWGQNKHIQSNEMEAMIRKQRERESEGKESAFQIRGRPVNPEKIKRYGRDHPIQPIGSITDGGIDMNTAPPATPAAIVCYTPSDAGPVTPQETSNPQQRSYLEPLLSQQSSGYGAPPPPQYNSLANAPPSQGPAFGCGGLSQGFASPNSSFPGQWPPSANANAFINGNPQAPPPPPGGMIGFGQGAPQGYAFQYSNCSGRRKALLIGINYFGQRGQLRGCINDVRNMSAYLNEGFGYKREDMVILTDDQQNPMSQPTKQNMLRAMHWLVKEARPNDSLFFHYSGHGGQTRDLDGDEEDGYDEVIYPVDFRKVGHIVDDQMHSIMVRPLQPGVRLTAIFDSCHSGLALDLPYMYSTQGLFKEPNLAKEAGQGLLGVISNYSQGNLNGAATGAMGFFKKTTATTTENAYNRTVLTKTSPADVIMLSGSKDNQKSADANIAAQATGAMSWAFITSMKKNPQQSYVQLLNSMQVELAIKLTTRPQLSCSHPLNTNLLFVM